MTRKEYILLNKGEIRYNSTGNILVLGCNYHITWQSNKAMRFVLDDIKGDVAHMITRRTMKRFTCKVDELIVIRSAYNSYKAKDLLGRKFEFLPVYKPDEAEERIVQERASQQAGEETNSNLEQS